MAAPGTCEPLSALASVRGAAAYQCDQCVVTGDSWVHLRICQECGATLCCDNSMNRHATRHAQVSGQPVVASAEPGERWLYCYPDRVYGEY